MRRGTVQAHLGLDPSEPLATRRPVRQPLGQRRACDPFDGGLHRGGHGRRHPDPATDANLDIAHTLSIAGERLGDDELRESAQTVARAIVGDEVAKIDDGLVLFASPGPGTAAVRGQAELRNGADHAAGDEEAVALTRAEELDREEPTYYGGALAALGRLFLTTDLLDGC